MKSLIFAVIVLITSIMITNCDQTTLYNEEAQVLIKKALNLPVSYRHDIDKRPSMGSGFELDGLRNAGLITGSEYLDSRRLIEIQITDLGNSCFIGENGNAYKFKTNDVDFDQITGIAINKNEQIATVRFTLKATNVTLAGYALAKTNAGFSGHNYIRYSLFRPLEGEMTFKKFDNGWQLASQQNDLLNQILNSDNNSNDRDDYSQQVQNKRDEVIKLNAAKENSFQDVDKFFSEFKNIIKTNDYQKLIDFISFPLESDYKIYKEEFVRNKNFQDLIMKNSLITETPSLFKYGENDYGIKGTSLKFSKKNGLWKLVAVYGSPDFDRN